MSGMIYKEISVFKLINKYDFNKSVYNNIVYGRSMPVALIRRFVYTHTNIRTTFNTQFETNS